MKLVRKILKFFISEELKEGFAVMAAMVCIGTICVIAAGAVLQALHGLGLLDAPSVTMTRIIFYACFVLGALVTWWFWPRAIRTTH